jgi:hypothetical protein
MSIKRTERMKTDALGGTISIEIAANVTRGIPANSSFKTQSLTPKRANIRTYGVGV